MSFAFILPCQHLREAYQSALSMYENFVGPEHFATMSRLLGYQGTSMVIQQLLNIMNSSVSDSQLYGGIHKHS